MNIIKQIVEMIDDELEGAEHYAKCAIKNKEAHPELAHTFRTISDAEMRHVSMLHDEVVKIIKEHRGEKGEPPAEMLAIWNYMHERHIDEAAEIKRYQEQYDHG